MLNWVCVPRVERGRVGLAGRGMPAGFVLVETVIAIGGKLGTVTRGLAGPAPPVRAGARRAEYNPRRAFFNGVVVSVHVGVTMGAEPQPELDGRTVYGNRYNFFTRGPRTRRCPAAAAAQ
jgi:hypothetical protein